MSTPKLTYEDLLKAIESLPKPLEYPAIKVHGMLPNDRIVKSGTTYYISPDFYREIQEKGKEAFNKDFKLLDIGELPKTLGEPAIRFYP